MTIERAYAIWRNKNGAVSVADLIAAADELPDSCRGDVVERIGEWLIGHADIIVALEEIASEQMVYKGHGDYDITSKLTADVAMMRAREAFQPRHLSDIADETDVSPGNYKPRLPANAPTTQSGGDAADAEAERIFALSDEDVIAETIAAGEDPDEVVKRGRAAIEIAIVASRALRVAANERAAAQSNSEFQRSLMEDAFVAGAEWQHAYTRQIAWQARAKHTSGPGGVSLTDADKFLIADMRAIIEDGDSHGRAATHPTTIHLRQGLEQLILLITRLQGSPS